MLTEENNDEWADEFATCEDGSDQWSRDEAAGVIDYSPRGEVSSPSSYDDRYYSPPPPPSEETSRYQRQSLASFVFQMTQSPSIDEVKEDTRRPQQHFFNPDDENKDQDIESTTVNLSKEYNQTIEEQVEDDDEKYELPGERRIKNGIEKHQEEQLRLESMLSTVEAEKDRLLLRLKETELALTEMESKLAESKRERRLLSERLGAAEASCLVAQREAAASEQRAQDADRRAEAAFDQIAQLDAELNIWRSNNSELSASLSLARRRLAAATDTISSNEASRKNSSPQRRRQPTLADATRRRKTAESTTMDPETVFEPPPPPSSLSLNGSATYDDNYSLNQRHISIQQYSNSTNHTNKMRVKHLEQPSKVSLTSLATKTRPRRDLSSGSPPFATERDDALIAQRQPYEQQLLKLQIERDHLITEIGRFPQFTRSNAIRDRKIAAENQLQRIEAQAQRLKARLRDTSPLLTAALSPDK